ncbi:MAG TPA: hypothetical protein VJR02_16135 [Pyrinomonadaceae bacterium]|nr:hypothetical protein [Pyrinomonadaceae bacterium]
MPEDTERTSAEDVLQSSELAARLLRRLVASPGVIDTQRVFKTYTRLTEFITHTHPLLQDLLARFSIDDDSGGQNLPFVMDQQWMLNLNTYLTNNNSYSSSQITNNSFLATSNTSQFISTGSTSSSTHTELHEATSQSSPPETFRVKRSAGGQRQSASVDVRETLVRAPLVPPLIQRELPKTEMKTSRLVLKDTVLSEKSGFQLGQGQYRNAVASGESRDSNPSVIDVQRQPDATALQDRPLPTVTLEPKDTLRIKNERHSVTERSIEVQQETNTTRTLFEKTESAAPAPTPPTLPLAHEQLPPSQFQTRSQQLVWRKSADTLTLRDLVSDLSSSGPLASVRQALDSLPMAQVPAPSSQISKPESSSRVDEPSPTGEEITTEGMLRRISRALLIERERRGY